MDAAMLPAHKQRATGSSSEHSHGGQSRLQQEHASSYTRLLHMEDLPAPYPAVVRSSHTREMPR